MAAPTPTAAEPNFAHVANHIRHNQSVLQFNRVFASLLAGAVIGISGVTGYKGFILYIVFHGVYSLLLLSKTGFQSDKYFTSSWTLLTSGIASQTELLTFILFWTLTNNLVYLF